MFKPELHISLQICDKSNDHSEGIRTKFSEHFRRLGALFSLQATFNGTRKFKIFHISLRLLINYVLNDNVANLSSTFH